MNLRPVHYATRSDGRCTRRIRADAVVALLVIIATSPCTAEERAPIPLTMNAPILATAAAEPAVDGNARPLAAHGDAAKGSGFAVPRYVIASGGGSSSGGAFAVAGTIGQLDADPLQPASGGVFSISGGFWPGLARGTPLGDAVFLDGFESIAP